MTGAEVQNPEPRLAALADAAGEVAVAEHRPVDVVEPERLSGVVEGLKA